MNDEIEEVEALLKPTLLKRKIILLVLTIALALLIALGVCLNNQVEYLQVSYIQFSLLDSWFESYQVDSKYSSQIVFINSFSKGCCFVQITGNNLFFTRFEQEQIIVLESCFFVYLSFLFHFVCSQRFCNCCLYRSHQTCLVRVDYCCGIVFEYHFYYLHYD